MNLGQPSMCLCLLGFISSVHRFQFTDYSSPYSTLLSIRELEIKTTMKYHLTPVRMAVKRRLMLNRNWHGHGKKRNLYTVSGNIN